MKYPRSSALVLMTAALGAGPGLAQAPAGNVARMYVVTPKPGMGAQAEAAIRMHAQWRKASHDPWTWSVYTPETGELGAFLIRSGGHAWSDFDAYDKGFGPQGAARFDADVGPLVESIRSQIDVMLPEGLNNPPPPNTNIQFVNLTTFHLRAGMEPQFLQLVGQAVGVLKSANWPPRWVWAMPASGSDDLGPTIILAGLAENWAAMKDPDPNFDAVLTKSMGKDGFTKWQASLNQVIRGTTQVTLRYRPDLSVTMP